VERYFQAFPSRRKYIGLKQNCSVFSFLFRECFVIFFLAEPIQFWGLKENNAKFTQYSGKSKYLSFHQKGFAKRIFFAAVSDTEVLVVETKKRR
jgi:hypothetical protein